MSLLIAWRMSVSANPPSGDDAFDILATIGASTGLAPLFIAYIIGLLGVFSTGHEYRHGMIRATLTAVPEPDTRVRREGHLDRRHRGRGGARLHRLIALAELIVLRPRHAVDE